MELSNGWYPDVMCDKEYWFCFAGISACHVLVDGVIVIAEGERDVRLFEAPVEEEEEEEEDPHTVGWFVVHTARQHVT